jgi:hypothetical protein
MTLVMKSVLITAGLGILLVIVEWNMKRKQKGGLTAADKRAMRDLLMMTVGACGLVAFTVHFLTSAG